MFPHHSPFPWGSFRSRHEEKWGSFRGRDHFGGQFGDHFRVGDHFGGCTDHVHQVLRITLFQVISYLTLFRILLLSFCLVFKLILSLGGCFEISKVTSVTFLKYRLFLAFVLLLTMRELAFSRFRNETFTLV